MIIPHDVETSCDNCPLCRGGGEPADGGEDQYCGATGEELPFEALYTIHGPKAPPLCPLRAFGSVEVMETTKYVAGKESR